MFAQEAEETYLTDWQRYFRIGYYRTYQLIKAMENTGIIATLNHNGKHKIL